LLQKVPVNKIREFEAEFLSYMEQKHKDTLNLLKAGKIDDSITAVIEDAASELTSKYSK
jgi:F-type H+-transporting ATPase subunit alpha